MYVLCLKMSYAGCPGPSLAISAQFTLKMCVAAINRKKITENLYLVGSRSFKVINVSTNKKLVTIACYDKQMYVLICNRFYATRVKTVK